MEGSREWSGRIGDYDTPQHFMLEFSIIVSTLTQDWDEREG